MPHRIAATIMPISKTVWLVDEEFSEMPDATDIETKPKRMRNAATKPARIPA